jgi:DUF1009 family protein
MLALIAGTGDLPKQLYARLDAEGTPPLVYMLDGFPPDIAAADPVAFRLETLGTLLADMKTAEVRELCLVGAIRRPQIDPSRIDAATAPMVPVLQQALKAGDDGALRAVIGLFEEAGFRIRGVDSLMPELLPASGILVGGALSDTARDDAERAEAVIDVLAQADIGQACVVSQGQVIAAEALPGTDWMLRSLEGEETAQGGLLYKAPKPGQDRRVDLPTIGPETVRGAARAGLSGIVIEAGGVMVIDLEEVVETCKSQNLFLWVRPKGGA